GRRIPDQLTVFKVKQCWQCTIFPGWRNRRTDAQPMRKVVTFHIRLLILPGYHQCIGKTISIRVSGSNVLYKPGFHMRIKAKRIGKYRCAVTPYQWIDDEFGFHIERSIYRIAHIDDIVGSVEFPVTE